VTDPFAQADDDTRKISSQRGDREKKDRNPGDRGHTALETMMGCAADPVRQEASTMAPIA